MKYLIFILLLFIVAAGVGYYFYSKPVASTAKARTEVEITASDLLEAFEADEENANRQYLDKVVEVSGVVAKIDTSDMVTIYLETGNPLSNIVCQLEKSQEDWPDLKETVVVKGVCTGYLMDVVLVRCVVQRK